MKTIERTPSVCMDPTAHFDGNVWERGFLPRLRLLSDRRIAFYERQRHQQREVRLRQVGGNRLIYSV